MSILTYDNVSTVRAGTAEHLPLSVKRVRKGFWSRLFDRIVEARMRQAELVLARHGFRREDRVVSE